MAFLVGTTCRMFVPTFRRKFPLARLQDLVYFRWITVMAAFLCPTRMSFSESLQRLAEPHLITADGVNTFLRIAQANILCYKVQPQKTIVWKDERRCAMCVGSAVFCTMLCVTVSAVCSIAAKCGCWIRVLHLVHLYPLLFSLRKSTHQLTSANRFNSLETYTGK